MLLTLEELWGRERPAYCRGARSSSGEAVMSTARALEDGCAGEALVAGRLLTIDEARRARVWTKKSETPSKSLTAPCVTSGKLRPLLAPVGFKSSSVAGGGGKIPMWSKSAMHRR